MSVKETIYLCDECGYPTVGPYLAEVRMPSGHPGSYYNVLKRRSYEGIRTMGLNHFCSKDCLRTVFERALK